MGPFSGRSESLNERLLAPLTGYPKFEQIAPDGPPVSTDNPVGDLYPECLRKGIGIEAQRLFILPYQPEARPFELEPSRIRRRTVFAARFVEAQEQREAVAEPQKAEVSLEGLQLSFGHSLFEAALALHLALAERDLLRPLGVEQEAGVVHAAKASRVRVVIRYQIYPSPLGRQFQVKGIIHKGVRSVLLLVPQHLPVQFAPGQVVVGDRVDRGLEGPRPLPPPERELARDQGVAVLLEEQERIGPLANDHWPSLAAWRHAAFGSSAARSSLRPTLISISARRLTAAFSNSAWW